MKIDYCVNCEKRIKQIFIDGVGVCPFCKRCDSIEIREVD